jgi:hypothetical protein
MRRSLFVILSVLIIGVLNADAAILINEFLADPPSINGDANNDGTVSAANDEFIELINNSDIGYDLAGWQISDSLRVRHIFPEGSFIGPREFMVVFGGGAPVLPGLNYQTASTGTLSLNNTADLITFSDRNGFVIDSVDYGALAGNDQSLNRLIDGRLTEFVLHTSMNGAEGRRFSPGILADGSKLPTNAAAVPEIPTLISYLLGCTGLVVSSLFRNVS